MYKSVFAALKPAVSQQYIIEYAVDLAKRANAELTVASIIDPLQIAPPEPVPLGGGAFKKERDEALLIAARSDTAEAHHLCQSVAANTGVSCHTKVCDGNIVDIVSRLAHEHDLVVLGHGRDDDTGDESLLHQLVKHAARPVVIFPKQPATGDSVVVAYDGSMQSARTLASFAYSGLGEGRTVHVLSLHADQDQAKALCEVACRYLQRHGINPNAARREAGSRSERRPGHVGPRSVRRITGDGRIQ